MRRNLKIESSHSGLTVQTDEVGEEDIDRLFQPNSNKYDGRMDSYFWLPWKEHLVQPGSVAGQRH